MDVVQNKVEPVIIAHGQNQGPRPKGWKRPFLETLSARRPAFTQTIRDSLEFPEKDESVGELQIGFVGPEQQDFLEGSVSTITHIHVLFSSHVASQALDMLATYLTSSPVAPLNKEFVEIENPLWYVDIGFFG